MRSRRNSIEKHAIPIGLGILVVLLLLPMLLRGFLIGVPPGYESYYHHYLAEHIFSLAGANPFHFILAGFQFLFGDWSFYVVPLLFGLLNVVLLMYLFSHFQLKKITKTLILFLYVSSPLFLWSSWFLTPVTVALFFQLLGSLFLIRKDKFAWCSLPFYVMASFFGFVHLLINTIFTFCLKKNKKNELLIFYSLLVFNAVIAIFYYLPASVFSDTASRFSTHGFLVDFGSISGFSIFLVLLALVGVVLLLKKPYWLYGGFVLLVFHSYLSDASKIYTNILFCIAGGHALVYLINKRWELKGIRTLFLLLVAFALLFSSISFISQAVYYSPSSETYDGFASLTQLPEDSLIFSSYEQESWVRDIGERRSLFDEYTPEKVEDVQFVLDSYNLEDTTHILSKYRVTHVLLHKNDLAPGLRFVLTNSETFKRAYSSQEITIWELLNTS